MRLISFFLPQNGAYWNEQTKEVESLDLWKLQGKLLRLDDVAVPDSLYGLSKCFGEDLGKFYAGKNVFEKKFFFFFFFF